MKTPACAIPLPHERLLAYWFGELEAAAEAELESHLFDCAACHTQLEELAAMGHGVQSLMQKGALRTMITDKFIQWLGNTGVRLREYRVPAFGSVPCSVAPDDDVVVSRLEADLRNIERVDALIYAIEGEGFERLEDLPFGSARDSLAITTPTELLRSLPDCTVRMRLLAVEANGERVLGDYTFNHSAMPRQ